MADIKIKGFIVNGKQYELDIEANIGKLVAPDGKEYELKVDNDGNLYTYHESVTPIPAPTGGEVTAVTPTDVNKLYINSLYCGGSNANEHSLNYCSHNFVELANLTAKDINLNGMYLQYAEKGNGWAKLPLKGVIKSGSTFLIRGAQCSVMDSSLTKIKVEHYDMEWLNQDGSLIKFSTDDAKFYLCFGEFAENNPFKDGPKVVNGYIDLIGINGKNRNVDAYESAPYEGNPMNERLFKKYYAMDPVSQATKDISARKNSTLWNYVDLTKNSGEVIPNIEDYTPRASFENKNIFYNKTKLFEDKPSMITCTFGIQATDNGDGATRCFNWLSKGLFDEFIWIKPKTSNNWGIANESFKNEIGVRQYYNRKTKEYSDGIVMTAHKFIKKGLAVGEYEYVAGHKNSDGTPNLELCTPIRSFKVRSTEDVKNGFTFVQTSDQQGFNWDEYNVWSATANIIRNEDTDNAIEFMVNTGDMTQNGNRIGEWLDYFNGKNDYLNNKEEMAIIGNNDLSPKDLYKLGNGSDGAKLSLENIEFFYCFEIDEENPPIFTINSVDYYIPSLYSFNYGSTHFLCMNSEIKAAAESNNSGTSVYDFSDYGNFYPKIKEWCENDMEKNSGFTWNIAYCHEMPFTILTTGVTYAADVTTNKEIFEGGDGRQGSNMNTNVPRNLMYWFSEFCQTHNIRLVFGGHKHTQSTSWPMLENVKYEGDERKPVSFRPIIVLSNDNWLAELKEIAGDSATELVTLEDGRHYPNNWILNGEIMAEHSGHCFFCEFKLASEIEEGVHPVVYAMSQATSYKHTSNKELPANNIPWLRYCYGTAKNATKPDNGQKFPFYTIWTITNNKIEGKVRKGYGIFNNSGNYDVNIQGEFVRQGKCATDNEHNIDLYSKNGIKPSAENEIIEIVK